MKYNYELFKRQLPSLAWDKQTLADKLSLAGHETEIYGETLDVTLTSNRKDCKDLNYLLFDLAGVYGLELTDPLTGFGHGPEVLVTAADVNKILGSNIDSSKLGDLERLGFVVTETGVQPPDFRDVANKNDVAEEIVRLIGYDALAIEPLSKQDAPTSPDFEHIQAVRFALANAGWTETATNSFSAEGQVELKNPFTETEPFLRSSLQTGLLQTLAKNPFMKRSKFFEIGDVYNSKESTKIGLLTSGYKDISAASEEVSGILGAPISFQPIDSAVAVKQEAKQGNIFLAEVEIGDLTTKDTTTPSLRLPTFKLISKFPSLVRDLTIFGKDDETNYTIRAVSEQFPQLLLVEVIDRYVNPETNISSTTIRFLFQKMDGSFTQEEIDTISNKLETFLK